MTYRALVSIHRVRIPRLVSRVFKVMYGATAPAVFLLGEVDAMWLMPLISLGSLLLYALPITSYILSLVDSLSPGAVELEADAVVVRVRNRASRRIPRREIASAIVVRRILQHVPTATVELSLRTGDRLNLRFDDAEVAETIVRALGFGPDGARLHVDLAQPSRRLLHLPIAAAIYVILSFANLLVVGATSGASFVMSALLQLVVYYFVTKRFAAPKVVVGRDGVVVTRGFRRRRLGATDPELDTALRGIGIDRARADAVVRAARERAGDAQPGANVFERGTLSVGEWRQRIVAALDGGYRMTGNVTELAKSVLAGGDVTPDQRIGAALALRVSGDVESVHRAAAATADERVRVALEAVANCDDDRTIERAAEVAAPLGRR